MLRVLLICWFTVGFLMCLGHVQFTNLKCYFPNRTLGEVKECRIIAVNRTHKYISIYASIYFIVDENVMGNFKVLRNDQGYKPFFIDINYNPCTFLKKQGNPILSLLYKTFKDTSNLNHTCPIDHDLVIDKFWTGNHEALFLNILPIPNGEYVLIFSFSNIYAEVGHLKVYMKIIK